MRKKKMSNKKVTVNKAGGKGRSVLRSKASDTVMDKTSESKTAERMANGGKSMKNSGDSAKMARNKRLAGYSLGN